MNIILVYACLIFVSVMASHVSIPIEWSSTYEPMIWVDVKQGESPIVTKRVHLTAGSLLHTSSVHPGGGNVTVALSDDIIIPYEFEVANEERVVESQLGIGPSSPLVDWFGSVAILRSDDTTDIHQLVLGISESEFRSRCINEDRATVIPFVDRDEDSVGVVARVHFDGHDTLTEQQSYDDIYPVTSGNHILKLRPDVANRIIEYLEANGAVRKGRSNVFSKCKAEIVENVGYLVFDFYGVTIDGFHEFVNRMYVDASAYIEHKPRSNRCTLRFETTAEEGERWSFAPLAIALSNVYIDTEKIIICYQGEYVEEEETTTTTTTTTTTRTSTIRTTTTKTEATTSTTTGEPDTTLGEKVVYGVGFVFYFIGKHIVEQVTNGYR